MLHTFYDLIGRDTNPILWWQMTIRAVIVFVYAMLLYRIVPVRVFGGSAAPDLVIAVIVGSSLSRALTGNAALLPALAATGAIALLYTLLAILARHFRPVSWLVKGRSIVLVRDGKMDPNAMARADRRA